MRSASITLLSLVLATGTAAAAPVGLGGPAPSWLPPARLPVGLQLRDGAPEPPPTSAPPSAPAPRTGVPAKPAAPASVSPAEPVVRNPVDLAVDAAMRQRFNTAAPPRGRTLDAAAASGAAGVAPSPPAQRALDEIARGAGLPPGQLTGVSGTPRALARALVERLFDPAFGDARVRAQYGLAGALAAEATRRVRDVYQILDLNPEQKERAVDVAEAALIAGSAGAVLDDPDVERLEVDPGARIDRARFERAVADSGAVVRCLRPTRRGGDRAYVLELTRRGTAGTGGACRDPWSTPAAIAAPGTPEPLDTFGSSGAPGGIAADSGNDGRPGAIEIAPLGPGATAPPSSGAAAPIPPGAVSANPGAWRYIVTNGPDGPVVTVAPVR